MHKKRNIVEWAMHYRQIVILITSVLVAFGTYALVKMNKNEFPDFTIRQGVAVAVYPGASSAEIEEQVTKPLENYIFTFKEVKKEKTKSYSRNGVSIVQIELNDDIDGADKENFWSRFKLGVQQFKTQLPSGVVALVVNDDFGDASSLLITMESRDKTYRELGDYMDRLKTRLRSIESVGRLTVTGGQQEQIAIYVDTKRLAQYGIGQSVVSAALMSQGFNTTAGTQQTPAYDAPIQVASSLNAVNDVEQMVVYSGPDGHVVRVKDVATVRREYAEPTSFVTNNGKKCLVLSVEIKKGRSITEMGSDIKRVMADFQQTLPDEVSMFTITDQSQVVGDSVVDFLKELLIAIVAVIIVVMLLLPMRVALVAASTIPISIFISLGLFYAFGIELNTVTLAALIVTLGMIVDNSIVIIDNYVELLGEGKPRWEASIQSATHFFKSILTATLAISVTFFPLLLTMKGMFHDFLLLFPWGMTIVLVVSLLVAELVVPFLQFYFIRGDQTGRSSQSSQTSRTNQTRPTSPTRPTGQISRTRQFSQSVIALCFRHPYAVIASAVASVVIGVVLILHLPQKMMPTAERNQFAVEIYLPTGTSLQRTVAVADSLEHILRRDSRVVSIASFKGTASPRFQTSYAPQFGGKNYAQFIVNTRDNEATLGVLADYRMRYTNAFPGAYVRFKQLSYSGEGNSVEIRLSGDDWTQLKKTADSVTAVLRQNDSLILVRNDVNEPLLTTNVQLDQLRANRVGVTNAQVELAMATRYASGGIPVTTIWNGDYGIPVTIKTTHAAQATTADIADEPIPVAGGLRTVPLRQIATVRPAWEDGQIAHRNGVRTITVMADVIDGPNVMAVTQALQKQIQPQRLPAGITMEWGGEYEQANEATPQIMGGLMISIVIIFFLMLAHFRRIKTAALLLVSLSLVVFGTAMGVLIPGGAFSLTCYLGVISLMGILVRNVIIMYDYAEELRSLPVDENNPDARPLTAHEAIYQSALRRMRPIFLTSAAASMGVIPMILGGSGLWQPMGNVIFFGTIITLVIILTVMPIAYWLLESGSTARRLRSEALEHQ
ncbi:MAG: efflux RND transporter permease subunit [Prevotella sp.]|nr:efflux RND transporter permease subunit [Prevotella sp.]